MRKGLGKGVCTRVATSMWKGLLTMKSSSLQKTSKDFKRCSIKFEEDFKRLQYTFKELMSECCDVLHGNEEFAIPCTVRTLCKLGSA